MTASILFFGKRDDAHVERALMFLRPRFFLTEYLGDWADPFPNDARQWTGDYIVSYLSRWVIPAVVLERAKVAAINFHPASPDYPGIGCNNFALYEGAREYGATCHHMAPQVDTGRIIAVRRFPVSPLDDVASLLNRTYDEMQVLFYGVMECVEAAGVLPLSSECWTRKPHTRREFKELCRITPDMSEAEIRRRVRATNYGQWKPVLEAGGYTWELKG